MYLYDGKSSIEWFYDGLKTRKEMDGNIRYPQSDRPAVLYDDGNGKVYKWTYLYVLASQYEIEMTEDAQAVFDAVVAAMENFEPVTLDSVDAKATEAKTTAEAATLAIGELGVMAADAQVTNSQLAQAVAELGVLVAGISAE